MCRGIGCRVAWSITRGDTTSFRPRLATLWHQALPLLADFEELSHVPKPKTGKKPEPECDETRAGAGGAPGGVLVPCCCPTSVPPDGSLPASGPVRRRRSRPAPPVPFPSRAAPRARPLPRPVRPVPAAPVPMPPRAARGPVRPRRRPGSAAPCGGASIPAPAAAAGASIPAPRAGGGRMKKPPAPGRGRGQGSSAGGIAGKPSRSPSRPALRHPSPSQTPPIG